MVFRRVVTRRLMLVAGPSFTGWWASLAFDPPYVTLLLPIGWHALSNAKGVVNPSREATTPFTTFQGVPPSRKRVWDAGTFRAFVIFCFRRSRKHETKSSRRITSAGGPARGLSYWGRLLGWSILATFSGRW